MCLVHLTLDVTGAEAQPREPKCAAFGFPLTDLLAVTTRIDGVRVRDCALNGFG